MSQPCETCGEPVLEARVDGRAMMVHPEAFVGIKLDQKYPAQMHYVSGKVANFYVLHECKPAVQADDWEGKPNEVETDIADGPQFADERDG